MPSSTTTSTTTRTIGRWMRSSPQSHPRCSSRFPRRRLPRRPGTPSRRLASAATVPASPHCRHFARSGRTWPSSPVKTSMTLLSVLTLLQKMVTFGDDTYDEERAVEKLFRCVPERYRQTARSIKSLLDLSTMTIEEAIGRLKVVDNDEPQPPREASPSVGSSTLLRSSGRPGAVTGGGGALFLDWWPQARQAAKGARRCPSRGTRARRVRCRR